jgi:hypothetical protein
MKKEWTCSAAPTKNETKNEDEKRESRAEPRRPDEVKIKKKKAQPT